MQLEVPESAKLLFVTASEDGHTLIEANQPSDCIELRRLHVKSTKVDRLHLLIESRFTTFINGPANSESPQAWQKALQHVLDTFCPVLMVVPNVPVDVDIETGSQMKVGEGLEYKAFWNEQKDTLIFRL